PGATSGSAAQDVSVGCTPVAEHFAGATCPPPSDFVVSPCFSQSLAWGKNASLITVSALRVSSHACFGLPSAPSGAKRLKSSHSLAWGSGERATLIWSNTSFARD